jgi:hypothetical protein
VEVLCKGADFKGQGFKSMIYTNDNLGFFGARSPGNSLTEMGPQIFALRKGQDVEVLATDCTLK